MCPREQSWIRPWGEGGREPRSAGSLLSARGPRVPGLGCCMCPRCPRGCSGTEIALTFSAKSKGERIHFRPQLLHQHRREIIWDSPACPSTQLTPGSQRTGSWAGSGGSRILVLHTDSTDLKSRALLSLEPHRLLCSPIHGLLGGAWTQMAWATKALTRRSPALTSVGGCERRGYLPAQKLPLNLASNNRPTRPHLTRKLLFSA